MAKENQLLPKRRRRLPGLTRKVLALYPRGMTTHNIQGAPERMYGVTVSLSLNSAVTDSVMEDVTAWQSFQLRKITKKHGAFPTKTPRSGAIPRTDAGSAALDDASGTGSR